MSAFPRLARLARDTRHRCVALLVTLGFIAVGAARAHAQVVEIPVAFDSAGHVRSVTPALQSRLQLTVPAFPVTGDYVEARLYSVSTGGYVIVAQRSDGTLERFALTDRQAATLRATADAALVSLGRMTGEEAPATISEPARGAFVRNQVLAAAWLYGPAVATLTHNYAVGTAAYFATIGGTFFYVTNLSKHTTVTKSQNDLATDGAVRGTAAVLLTANALGLDLDADLGASGILLGGLGGSILGYWLGRGLTQSEAQAMSTGSTLAALTAVGLTSSVHAVDDDDDGRLVSGMAVAAGVAGYVLGPSYPRRARYTVTAGDIQMLRLGAMLGVMTSAVPIAGGGSDPRVAAGLLTAGLVAGTLAGDLIFVRPYDHTQSDAALVSLGALAGGLMGIALPVAAESGNGTIYMSTATLGAILGTLAAEHLIQPRRAGDIAPIKRTGEARGRAARWHFDPTALALAATRARGVYPVVGLTF